MSNLFFDFHQFVIFFQNCIIHLVFQTHVRRKLQVSSTPMWAVTDAPAGSPGAPSAATVIVPYCIQHSRQNRVQVIVSTAKAVQVNDKKKKNKKTQNRNETNPTISKFTWTVTSLTTLFKGNDNSNNTQSSGAFAETAALRSQALLGAGGRAILRTHRPALSPPPVTDLRVM